MNYGKYKYEMEKKAKEAKKKQHTIEIKEIKIRYKIDVHDYNVRIKNIKNERARKQALAAELLVFYSVKKLRPKNIPIPPLRAAGEFGKPYFTENNDFKFNISHSGDWAVIAVSDCEIGIDIEKIGKLRTNIEKRILHEKEKKDFLH